MKTTEAVLSLRDGLGLSRDEFAQRVGVSAKMIQRIEGGQQPTTRVLAKLAKVAGDAGLSALADLFEATRRADMGARVKAVRNTARVRRVALTDLKYWSAYLEQTYWQINEVLSANAAIKPEVLIEYLRNAAQVMGHVRDEIEIPIAEPYSEHFTERQAENEQILRHHQGTLPRGLQGRDNAKTKTRKR